MEFTGVVTGLAAKDTSNGNKIELKLTVQFDTALFAQLGDCFTDRVHVTVNHPQQSLDFKEAAGEDDYNEEVVEAEMKTLRG